MPKCKNSSDKYYNGKENTPLGRGYCSSEEKEGKRMKGKDSKMYEVIKTKTSKKWSVVKKRNYNIPVGNYNLERNPRSGNFIVKNGRRFVGSFSIKGNYEEVEVSGINNYRFDEEEFENLIRDLLKKRGYKKIFFLK